MYIYWIVFSCKQGLNIQLTSTKSVASFGILNGDHLSWFGFGGHFEKSLVKLSCFRGLNGRWWTAGRIRYNQLDYIIIIIQEWGLISEWHLLLLVSLGHVKAVPDSCSAYNPYGHTWGEF